MFKKNLKIENEKKRKTSAAAFEKQWKYIVNM